MKTRFSAQLFILLASTFLLSSGKASAQALDDLQDPRIAKWKRFVERNHIPPEGAERWRRVPVHPHVPVPPISPENAAELKALSDRYDANRDGRVSANEVRAAFNGRDPLRESIQAKERERFDLNKDGVITLAEQKAILNKESADKLSKLRQAESDRIKLRYGSEVFGKFDTDADGRLNDLERLAFGEALDRAMRLRAKDVLVRFDADRDGQLSEPESAAFVAAESRHSSQILPLTSYIEN
jgi:Ca2+-binding EF-hand superfamily protein